MRDNNIFTRFIKPAGRKNGLDLVNWRCLRTSHATWLKLAVPIRFRNVVGAFGRATVGGTVSFLHNGHEAPERPRS
jgi:hypothetical protein